jgi:hypothetical protein
VRAPQRRGGGLRPGGNPSSPQGFEEKVLPHRAVVRRALGGGLALDFGDAPEGSGRPTDHPRARNGRQGHSVNHSFFDGELSRSDEPDGLLSS